MGPHRFVTAAGLQVPDISAEQMRDLDRIAMDDFGLGILQMMENAGRSLAENVLDMLGAACGHVTILAGAGGNGGGGLCAARHLHNRGFEVDLALDHDPSALGVAAAVQLNILQQAGLHPLAPHQEEKALRQADLVVDALIGYSLRGAPRGRTAELIAASNAHARRVLALDIPSGLDATTGKAPGAVISAERTLTLALPKTGLRRLRGELVLVDIGIPPEAFLRLGLNYRSPFLQDYWVPLRVQVQ